MLRLLGINDPASDSRLNNPHSEITQIRASMQASRQRALSSFMRLSREHFSWFMRTADQTD